MKLSLSIAAAATALVALAEAAPQGGWHVKVRVHTVKLKVFEECISSKGEVACADDLQCVQISDDYGSCMKKQPALYDQCGGHSTKGPWKNPCVAGGAADATAGNATAAAPTCVFVSPYYSQCQEVTEREHFRFKGHENDKHRHKHHKKHEADANSKGVPLWGQCVWIDSKATCDSGLQCITENEHYGQCRSLNAKLYEQCGGKTWKQPWAATCTEGVCVKRDEWYSQCLPKSTGATTSPSVTTQPGGGAVSGPTAAKWDQCGGASFSGPTACVAGTQCVKHNNWYSQCKPLKLPVGELCGENKRDSVWTLASCEGGATCKPSNADKSESRCQM